MKQLSLEDLDAKAEMWKLPASEVGAYAEKDAELTFKLWQHCKKIINRR